MRVNIILIKDSDYNLESIDDIQVSSISEISKIAKQKWSLEDIMKGEVVYI